MLRHRANSQKPADGLYAAFRESFPEVHSFSAAATSEEISPGDTLDYIKLDLSRAPSQSYEYISGVDLMPRVFREIRKFIPPWPDSNSLSPATLSNKPPVYSRPTVEGADMPYYNQDVNLATAEIGVQTGIKTLGDGAHVGWMSDTLCWSPQTVQPYESCHFNHFDTPQDLTPFHTPDQPSEFESPYHSTGSPPRDDGNRETETDLEYPVTDISCQTHDTSIFAPPQASTKKYRFHAALNAATAMTRQANEIPLTYLNKGQVYSVYIVDTAPVMSGLAPVQYRTSICISLGDRQQGPRSEACWNLWKEVRGTDEAQRRGGQLQGVEYVETGGIAECDGGTRVELETASLDRFSVLWTRGVDSSADCHVAMRFNFLSTDFSHSKGVKGILSRLCAKTEIISPNSLYFPSEISEICVCDVKVFRDHGAERKTSNDVAYVKKSIEKLKQQIVHAEAGTKHSKKRKRNGSNVAEIELGGPVKDPKHKKSPLRSSASLTEDLYTNLQTMRDMFISTQPVSVFYVLGQEQDGRDPYSPLPIDGLLQPHSQHLRRPPDRPVEVQLPQQVSPGNPTRWTKPLQVDFASKPLPDGLVEPVACFYVCYREPHPSATKEYYRAVYIMKGETKCLIAGIAAKCSFDPTRILQVVNVIQKAPGIKVDDDIAHGLPKCHEMVLDLSRITALPLMREWDKLAYATLNRKEVKTVLDAIQSEGYLLKLMF